MAEFKAQMLGILIVLAVFGVLLGLYENLANNTMKQISTKLSDIVENT